MKTISLVAFSMALAPQGIAAAQIPLQRLENSPRHHEWVALERGGRTLHCFVVYPETNSKAAAVVVIHENRGLTDWVRSVANELAEVGYVAIAPDLLSGAAPGGGKTDDFRSADAASEAIYQLPPEQVMADLQAASDYVLTLPAVDGTLFAAGFCWGGSQSFRFATLRSGLTAAFVFYGAGPEDPQAIRRIDCPVYGFYGEEDSRVNATLERTASLMEAAGKPFELHIYAGAAHAFMRLGAEPGASAANQRARSEAWERWKTLLARHAPGQR